MEYISLFNLDKGLRIMSYKGGAPCGEHRIEGTEKAQSHMALAFQAKSQSGALEHKSHTHSCHPIQTGEIIFSHNPHNPESITSKLFMLTSGCRTPPTQGLCETLEDAGCWKERTTERKCREQQIIMTDRAQPKIP